MSVQVQVKQGYQHLLFPDKSSHSDGDIFTLSDAMFALVPASILRALNVPPVVPPVLKPASSYVDSQGRVIGTGNNPTITNGAQAASAVAGPAGASDLAGGVTVTAVASPVAGVLTTVTFAVPYGASPKSIDLSDNSANAYGLYVSARSATSFTVSCRTAPAASATINFDYHVTG